MSEKTNLIQKLPITLPNRLVHAYYDIDLDVLWARLWFDLPPLVTEHERIIVEANR